jgi:hypothetical protein
VTARKLDGHVGEGVDPSVVGRPIDLPDVDRASGGHAFVHELILTAGRYHPESARRVASSRLDLSGRREGGEQQW